MRRRSILGAMRHKLGKLRGVALVAAAFAGGIVTSQLANANTESQSPYAPLDQLARVLVIVENQYVDPANRTKILEGAVKGMVAELDPHSTYMPPDDFRAFQGETEGQFGGVGLEVDARGELVTVVAPIEGSPAARAGMRSGDQILAIDGKPMRGESLEKMVLLMRGAPGTTVRVTVRRAGEAEPITFNLKREIIKVQSITAKRLDNDVAYIQIKQFQSGTHRELLRAVGDLRKGGPIRGVLLDLRGNPGGLVDEAEQAADELLGGGVIYTTRHRDRIIDEAKAKPGGALASEPIVALVSPYSASAAELLAGALQDNHRATIVGARTFGKGSVQTIFDLPDGAGLKLTTMRYYTPSGRSIQAQGIDPDVIVKEQEGLVIRESDLQGHLAAEGATKPTHAVVVTIPKRDQPKAEATQPREIPKDPSKGDDGVLAIGYERLLGLMR